MFNELGDMCERGEIEAEEAYELFKKFEDEMVIEICWVDLFLFGPFCRVIWIFFVLFGLICFYLGLFVVLFGFSLYYLDFFVVLVVCYVW